MFLPAGVAFASETRRAYTGRPAHAHADLVAAAQVLGLNVRAWGVGTREHLDLVYSSRADGTTLNWPDWAQ